ncbi:hypothetical protein ABSA28_00941 [Candidatus Hepatincolaceae symbiont of Richtersius coronifer]
MKKILLTVAFLGLMLGLVNKVSANEVEWVKSLEATYYSKKGSKDGLRILTDEIVKVAPSPEQVMNAKNAMEKLLKESEGALVATKYESRKYVNSMETMGENTLDMYKKIVKTLDTAFRRMSREDRVAMLETLKAKAHPLMVAAGMHIQEEVKKEVRKAKK